VQTITRESENVERESAFWTDRYMVRQRQSPPGGAFAPSDPRADMPSFLNSCRDIILTTGTPFASLLGGSRGNSEESCTARPRSTLVRTIRPSDAGASWPVLDSLFKTKGRKGGIWAVLTLED